MDNLQYSRRGGSCGEFVHNFSSSVARPIIYGDYLIVLVVESKQAAKTLLDVGFLVTSRDDDTDVRILLRLAIPFGLGYVGDLGHAKSSVQNARKPRQGENRPYNPGDSLPVHCLSSLPPAENPNRRSESGL